MHMQYSKSKIYTYIHNTLTRIHTPHTHTHTLCLQFCVREGERGGGKDGENCDIRPHQKLEIILTIERFEGLVSFLYTCFGLLFCIQFLPCVSSPFVHSFSHLGKERTDMGETGTNGGAGGISVSSRPSGDVEMQKGQDNETAAGSGTHLVGVVGKLRSQ